MSSKSSSSNTLTIALLATLGLAAGGALWWTYQQDKQAKTEGGPSEASFGTAEVGDASLSGQTANSSVGGDAGGVTVEEELSVDAEEEARKEAEAAEYKDKYDKAISMADKLMKGQRYLQASERYSEAIDILPFVPTAQGNILPLYNSRARCTKRAARSITIRLNDIALVLQMEPTHMKARVRKARFWSQRASWKRL